MDSVGDKKMDALHEEMKRLEAYHMDPDVRKHSKTQLADVLADDFFEIGSSGQFFYRADCLTDAGLGQWDTTMSDFAIHPLSDTLVLTTYRVEDRTRNRNTLRSSIWKLVEGKWRLYFHQGTIAMNPDIGTTVPSSGLDDVNG